MTRDMVISSGAHIVITDYAKPEKSPFESCPEPKYTVGECIVISLVLIVFFSIDDSSSVLN